MLNIIEYEELESETAKEVYEEIREELGFGIVPNLFKSMARRPGFLKANWIKFRSTVLEGELPRTLKEMIAVAISQHNNSDYALKVHLHSLSALGTSEEVLKQLQEDVEACPLPELEKKAILFGLKAAVQPHELSGEDEQELKDAGLSDKEIYELIATSNLFTGVNQYTDALNVPIDDI